MKNCIVIIVLALFFTSCEQQLHEKLDSFEFQIIKSSFSLDPEDDGKEKKLLIITHHEKQKTKSETLFSNDATMTPDDVEKFLVDIDSTLAQYHHPNSRINAFEEILGGSVPNLDSITYHTHRGTDNFRIGIWKKEAHSLKLCFKVRFDGGGFLTSNSDFWEKRDSRKTLTFNLEQMEQLRVIFAKAKKQMM